MRITRENGKAHVYTPYNKSFVAKIKQIGGARWDSDERCWTVPETEIEIVRDYMMDVYGETDQTDNADYVTAKVTFVDSVHATRAAITLFGKTIARAFGRDSGAVVGENVTVLSGGFRSGGSCKNWETVALADTVIKVRNVPRAALDNDLYSCVRVEVMQEDVIDKQALLEEKEKLLARLAEIEKLLA